MKDKVVRSRNIGRFGILLGMLVALLLLAGSDVYATEKRIIKVAFFPMDGYHTINIDGSYGGMDVEYLNALCDYVNWEIEYVECDSWEKALELLNDQKVDLVGTAQYSAERAKLFDYADISSGYTFGVIATSADSEIAYEDFHAMKDVTFGIVKNYVRRNEFFQYLSDNGIDSPTVVEYESTAAMQAALDNGEIDAFVHTFTEVEEGQRMIGRFAPRPFYYITYRGNDDVLRELNQAVVDLKMNQPELETELMNEYFYDKFDKTVLLTTEEENYLEEKGRLIVGYLDNYYPFSYVENGEFKGLTREMIEGGLNITGLQLEYRLFSNAKEAREALQDGEIDIFAYSTDTGEVLEEYGLKSVCDYAEVPLVLVTEKSKEIDKIKILATVDFLAEKAKSETFLDEIEIRVFESQQEGIDAVTNGSVDGILCNGYMAEHLMRTDFKYGNLQIKSLVNSEYSISIVIREKDKTLSNILEKTFSQIDSKMINEYMLRENKYPLVSIADFIKENSFIIIGILVLIMILVIFTVWHMLSDNKKIQKLMYKDTKMNIWNVNYFIFWGERKLLPERKMQYAIVYLNLAKFRRYNIIYGWDAGESLLESMVDTLTNYVDSNTEICARNQGDRFILLLNYQDKEALMERIWNIKKEIENRIHQETDNRMVLHVGIYYIPSNEIDLRYGINNANQALEYVENSKEKDIKVYDDSLKILEKERHEREKLLDSVDVNQDFVVYYQPKVDIRTGAIVGAEALVRFMDPTEGGAIKAPGYFIPYYEQTGKITDIDFFVFESTCKMLRRRMDADLSVVTVSCNFSRMHFIKPGFADRFEEILQKYDISKDLVEIEITETLVVEELQYHMVKETLDILKERGIHLSIDDFGAGYSSLGIFEQIPASVVKLDRSFLLNQENRERQVKIMRGIVKLSKELDAQVVCEGVETEKDILLMKEIGTYVAQGFYYSKPIPEQEFEERLNVGVIMEQ